MKKIIDWLIKTELRASVFYEKASARFPNDPALSEFLATLALEEKDHLNIMREMAALAGGEDAGAATFELYENSKGSVEEVFAGAEKMLDEGELTERTLFEKVVIAEFSEWNQLFLYVVHALRERRAFIPVAKMMTRHKSKIEQYVRMRPHLLALSESMRTFPPVLTEKILLVEDSRLLTELYSALLKDEGVIETATNGEEALEKLGENYYSALIVDVKMPVMDGLEFFERAQALYPDIKDRIIFCTGDATQVSWLKENDLKYLIKPVPIDEVVESLSEVLERVRP